MTEEDQKIADGPDMPQLIAMIKKEPIATAVMIMKEAHKLKHAEVAFLISILCNIALLAVIYT